MTLSTNAQPQDSHHARQLQRLLDEYEGGTRYFHPALAQIMRADLAALRHGSAVPGLAVNENTLLDGESAHAFFST